MEKKTIDKTTIFKFKSFEIAHDRCAMKVGTDGVLLGAWCRQASAKSALDIGSGSGLIVLMLAQNHPNIQIVGVEIDALAAQQSRENVAASPWSQRISIETTSIQAFAKSSPTTFDFIVTNPPFFSGGVLSDNQDRNAVRHTLKLSHHDLLTSVRGLLSHEGKFALILPYLEGLRLIELAATYQLYVHKKTEVRFLPHKPIERLLIEFGKTKTDSPEISDLIVQDKPNVFSADYSNLLSSFLLIF